MARYEFRTLLDCYGKSCEVERLASYNNNSPRRADTATDRHESAVVATGTFEAFGRAVTILIPTISIR
jgi:hypothetical protein